MSSYRLVPFLVLIAFSSGCAQIMNTLRRDLDDQESYDEGPTVGGRWAGSGLLSDDAGRSPASGSSGGVMASRSWVSPERAAANRRDAFRGQDSDEDEGPNSENSPVMEPGIRRQYKNGSRATRADFLDESQNEGSLWASDGQTNYYFTKNKIRGVGDILSISVEQDLVRDIAIEARRGLVGREREYELRAAQERLRMKAAGIPEEGAKKDSVASSAAAPVRAPAADGKPAQENSKESDVPAATYADVDMTKSLEIKAGDSMMGEIIERYPNGNYKVRATKKIPYRGGAPRLVSLVGVVKGTDITEEDNVSSGKLYEYRVDATR